MEAVRVLKDPRDRMVFSPDNRGALEALVRAEGIGVLEDEEIKPGYEAVREWYEGLARGSN